MVWSFKFYGITIGVLIIMIEADKNIARFVKHVKTIAKKHGVTIKISQSKNVRGPGETSLCAGYFYDDGKHRTIVVAAGKKTNHDWVAVLAHEYSHMMQWIEGDKTYKDTSMRNGEDSYYHLSMLESGKAKYSKRLRQIYTRKTIMCELNCERRTVKTIQEFNLPINVKQYKKEAAAILYKYLLLCKTGRWYGSPTEKNKTVLSKIKPSLKGRFIKLPAEIEKTIKLLS